MVRFRHNVSDSGLTAARILPTARERGSHSHFTVRATTIVVPDVYRERDEGRVPPAGTLDALP